jgi:dolichol kinase
MTTPAKPGTLQPEAARKAIHLVAGSLPVMYACGLDRGALLTLLGIASAIAVGIEGARHASPRAQAMFERGVGPMLRRHEHRGVTGATWLALSLLAAVLFLPQKPAIATLWCATIADPVASIVGRAGGHPSPRLAKTGLGSAACLLLAFVGVKFVAGFAPGVALAIAGAAMMAERYPGPFDDNLTVAAGVALVAGVAA